MASSSQLLPQTAKPHQSNHHRSWNFSLEMDKAELPKMAPPPPPPPPNWTAAIGELTKGRNWVSQLGAILPTGTDGDHLLREISASFSRALVALKSSAEEKSENFDAKKRKIESGQKGRPRKRTRSGSCTRITTAILNDGHSWRKYGQKTILNFKFPRCYFRCTNKYDQNCPAMKQVQQSEEDSSLYVVTYIGEHTCQRSAASLMTYSLENEKEACIINFGSGEEPKLPSPSLLATRHEYSPCEEGISSALTHHVSSSSECMPELETLEGSTHLMMGGGPERSDVTSCLQPSQEEEDDLVLDYFDFSDVFSFN